MKKAKGFTVVELLVCVSVISILATVGFVTYTNWRKGAAISAVKTELSHLASVVDSVRGFTDESESGFPARIPSDLSGGDKNVTLTYTPTADLTGYCATGKSVSNSAIVLSIQVSISQPFNNTYGGSTCGSAYPY